MAVCACCCCLDFGELGVGKLKSVTSAKCFNSTSEPPIWFTVVDEG